MNAFAAALAILTLVRLVVASTAPLAPDETYYWVWSHALAGGYLDHPPMVALWIKAGTLIAGQTPLGVRLLGPLSAAVASWMLFDAGRTLFPGGRAELAPVLLNATLLLGVGTVIMTPDSPLLFFWTATLWAAARLAGGGGGIWWLAAGVCGGLALDSKYTGLFVWLGIGLWTLWVPQMRVWLRRWQPWVAALIGLALFTPVLLWNADHGWAGFLKQGGRVGDWTPSRAAGFLAELAGSQIGLATPIVFVLCMAGLSHARGRSSIVDNPGHDGMRRGPGPAWSLLLALSVPPGLMFVQHAFGDRVQGNWPAIIYPALALAACGLPAAHRWWKQAAGFGFAITAVAYAQAVAGIIPLPAKSDPVAMRLVGWDSLAAQVTARGDQPFVAVEGYAPASELAWWKVPVLGIDDRWALTRLKVVPIGGKTGLLVRDARHREAVDPAKWLQAEHISTLTRPGAAFEVYRVTAADGVTAAELPRR